MPSPRSAATRSSTCASAPAVRLHLQDLRADVHVHPAHRDPRQLARQAVQARRILDRDAELRGRVAGARVVRAGSASRRWGSPAARSAPRRPEALRQLGERAQLPLRLHVEAVDPRVQRRRELRHRLPHPAEDDPLRRDARPSPRGAALRRRRCRPRRPARPACAARPGCRSPSPSRRSGAGRARAPRPAPGSGSRIAVALYTYSGVPHRARLRQGHVLAEEDAVAAREGLGHPGSQYGSVSAPRPSLRGRRPAARLDALAAGALRSERNSSSGITRIVAFVSSFTRSSHSAEPHQPV